MRTSRRIHPSFILAKGRSLGFASASADFTAPCSDSLSLRLRASSRLTSPATATRRLIMQKARRHPQRGSDRLQAHGFRVCFTPLLEVLFTFPSRYCALSVSREYLALPDGPGQFAPDSSCPALLRMPLGRSLLRVPDYHRLRSNFPDGSARIMRATAWSYNPEGAMTPTVWAGPRSLATTGGITVVFFSSGY